MKLIGHKLLQPLRGINPETDRWLNSWTSEVAHAAWKDIPDVKKQYPKAFVAQQGIFCFQVARQDVKIEVGFSFPLGIAIINGLRNE